MIVNIAGDSNEQKSVPNPHVLYFLSNSCVPELLAGVSGERVKLTSGATVALNKPVGFWHLAIILSALTAT